MSKVPGKKGDICRKPKHKFESLTSLNLREAREVHEEITEKYNILIINILGDDNNSDRAMDMTENTCIIKYDNQFCQNIYIKWIESYY